MAGRYWFDPAVTGTPRAPGTLQWGGAYGHSWFVDHLRGLSVVALTNTAFEGMVGTFPIGTASHGPGKPGRPTAQTFR